MSDIPDGYKRCSRGEGCVHPNGPILPATLDYFGRREGAKDGLDGFCKACYRAHRRSRHKKAPCPICGGPVPKRNGKYCSHTCKGKAREGVARPDMIGRIPWSAGKTAATDERVARIAQAKLKNVVNVDTLRDLYVTQNLSLREIGERYGVSRAVILRLVDEFRLERVPRPHESLTPELVKTLYEAGKNYTEIAKMYDCSASVVNAMGRSLGIEGRTYQNRAGIEPTAEELRHLYWDEWMSYEAIAALWGVDLTSIPYWLKKFHIPRRKASETRHGPDWEVPDPEAIIHLYQAENLGMQTIGKMFDVHPPYIKTILEQHNIPIRQAGYPNVCPYTARDGHRVKSGLELQVDNWLFAHGIAHDYEPALGKTRYRADFLIGELYIEVWGLMGIERYEEKRRQKLQVYEQLNLELLSIYPDDFPQLEILTGLLK